MRTFVSALAALAAIASAAAVAAPASAVTPPTVTFSVDGHRIVGSATHLPEGRKYCDFERSQPNPGMIIGSFGNDMVPVRARRTSKDSITLRTRPLPVGKYFVRMQCFVKNPKPGMNDVRYTIVAVNEGWLHVTRKPRHARPVR